MRFGITYLEGNNVMVTDKVQKDNYYGQVVNGKAVADSELSMKKISKALREAKKVKA